METIIKVEGISKYLKTHFWSQPARILNNISFEVKENQIFGFIGSNGAGKTTLIKCMLELMHFNGRVSFFEGKPFKEIRHLVGFQPEQPYFYNYLTARELLMYFARFFYDDRAVIKEKVEKVIGLTKLRNFENKTLDQFSKGMLQRVSLAQALINDPEILILDEPMSGLDPVGRLEFRHVIRELKNKGATVFFSTHILSDIEDLCDVLGIIKNGELLAVETVENIIKQSPSNFEDTIVKKYMAFE